MGGRVHGSSEKPVVYVVDEDGDLSKSPILISEALKCTFSSRDLHNVVTESPLAEEFSIRLAAFLEQAVKAVMAAPAPPLLKAYSDHDQIALPKLVANAKERINLITTNLSYWTDTENFVHGGEYAFDIAERNGIPIKVLTLDPESPMLRYRAEQLRFEHDINRYREELKRSARILFQLYRNSSKVTIRLYDDLPLQIAAIIDREIVTSFITRVERSRKNLHFLVGQDLPGADSFERHFTEVSAGPSKDISAFKWATDVDGAREVSAADSSASSRRRGSTAR